MKNSLFKKYFAICSGCVLSSILVLGLILMQFAARFFEEDKYGLLDRTVKQAASITSLTYNRTAPGHGYFEKGVISLIYSTLTISIDGDLILTDTAGRIIYFMENSEGGPRQRTDKDDTYLAPEIIDTALEQGSYRAQGTLGGFYEKKQFSLAVPVVVDDVTMAVLIATSPARGINNMLARLLEMFLLSALVVLLIALVLIYFITSRMVRPLKQMLAATHSFSKGDFSVRVPVAGYDEMGQLSMAFNNMASTLATTESSRRSFVANVSHELKTPMTTISGFVDGILDGTVPEEKRDHYLQVVSNEVKRLSRLVRSMLDTSRIEAGELKVNPTLFDISELVRQTIFSFEQNILDKDLQIEGLDVDRVMVYADRDLMNQVVYNLVENAVKFVNHDGTISFTYQTDGGMTRVAVRNTGEGLDKEEVPRLFDRFYKSDRSRSLNKNGVGLGLHIVKSIINYHQGEIYVSSVEGQYTEFEFSIPVPAPVRAKPAEERILHTPKEPNA